MICTRRGERRSELPRRRVWKHQSCQGPFRPWARHRDPRPSGLVGAAEEELVNGWQNAFGSLHFPGQPLGPESLARTKLRASSSVSPTPARKSSSSSSVSSFPVSTSGRLAVSPAPAGLVRTAPGSSSPSDELGREIRLDDWLTSFCTSTVSLEHPDNRPTSVTTSDEVRPLRLRTSIGLTYEFKVPGAAHRLTDDRNRPYSADDSSSLEQASSIFHKGRAATSPRRILVETIPGFRKDDRSRSYTSAFLLAAPRRADRGHRVGKRPNSPDCSRLESPDEDDLAVVSLHP